MAILRGRLHFPGGGSGGSAAVNFSVSRGGQITGARLTASSGNGSLDAAALAVFRGGLPPPPPGYVGALNFNMPVRFNVR